MKDWRAKYDQSAGLVKIDHLQIFKQLDELLVLINQER